jgi:hypothetical protein
MARIARHDASPHICAQTSEISTRILGDFCAALGPKADASRCKTRQLRNLDPGGSTFVYQVNSRGPQGINRDQSSFPKKRGPRTTNSSIRGAQCAGLRRTAAALLRASNDEMRHDGEWFSLLRKSRLQRRSNTAVYVAHSPHQGVATATKRPRKNHVVAVAGSHIKPPAAKVISTIGQFLCSPLPPRPSFCSSRP